jgi:hypothetical protein
LPVQNARKMSAAFAKVEQQDAGQRPAVLDLVRERPNFPIGDGSQMAFLVGTLIATLTLLLSRQAIVTVGNRRNRSCRGQKFGDTVAFAWPA